MHIPWNASVSPDTESIQVNVKSPLTILIIKNYADRAWPVVEKETLTAVGKPLVFQVQMKLSQPHLAKRKEPRARLRRAPSERSSVIRTAVLSGGADAAFKVVNIKWVWGPSANAQSLGQKEFVSRGTQHNETRPLVYAIDVLAKAQHCISNECRIELVCSSTLWNEVYCALSKYNTG